MVAVLIIVGGSGWYFMFAKNTGQANQDMPDIIKNDVNDEQSANTPVATDNAQPQNQTQSVAINQQMPETGQEYMIKSGQASYSVVKTYFGKPGETVTGMSEVVSGAGWLDATSNSAYINANLSFDDFKTGSDKRDSDIAPLFVDKSIVLEGKVNGLQAFVKNQPVTVKAPLSLTINQVKKDVVFDITVIIDDQNNIVAKGSTTINMKDFNVKAPSLVNVFSVGDSVVLNFDVVGSPTTN